MAQIGPCRHLFFSFHTMVQKILCRTFSCLYLKSSKITVVERVEKDNFFGKKANAALCVKMSSSTSNLVPHSIQYLCSFNRTVESAVTHVLTIWEKMQ